MMIFAGCDFIQRGFRCHDVTFSLFKLSLFKAAKAPAQKISSDSRYMRGSLSRAPQSSSKKREQAVGFCSKYLRTSEKKKKSPKKGV